MVDIALKMMCSEQSASEIILQRHEGILFRTLKILATTL